MSARTTSTQELIARRRALSPDSTSVRPATSLEGLAGLKPAFRPDGVVTAGTSSPLTDGAAAALVCSEDDARRHGLKIMVRIRATAVAGAVPSPGGDPSAGRVPAVLYGHGTRPQHLSIDARQFSQALRTDAEDENSVHDMGGNIIPMMVERGGAQVYDFSDNKVPGATDRDRGYWRDVGTLDSYYDAHMDLVSIHPIFNLYNRQWPILTHAPALPPAKFVFADQERAGHRP